MISFIQHSGMFAPVRSYRLCHAIMFLVFVTLSWFRDESHEEASLFTKLM